MNLKKLAEQAKKKADEARKMAEQAVEKRGGTEGLKKDATQVAGAFKGPGKLSEKAKRAADAVKKPG
ncbi:MAG: hypothetical protein LT070_10435 [Solirubrobacteraceae bacterium]|nr:hypothetical protein [Solirubrobacteraceae bacterium]